MNQRTQKNLVTATHGKAFAFVKYMLFAEQAAADGDHTRCQPIR